MSKQEVILCESLETSLSRAIEQCPHDKLFVLTDEHTQRQYAAEEQDGEKERERFHAFVFDSRFSPRRTPHGSGGLSCENSKKKRVDGGFDRFCCSAAGFRREIAATKKEETVAVSSFG